MFSNTRKTLPFWFFFSGEECQYQRISDASSTCEIKKQVQALIHPEPSIGKATANEFRVSTSDSEDLFHERERINVDKINNQYHRRASYDSLSTTASGSRRSSSCDTHDAKKTLVFLIGSQSASASLMRKQHSWETFPRLKNKRKVISSFINNSSNPHNQLKKVDSFEGHEEAVRTLVAAVQETRSQQQPYSYKKTYNRRYKTNWT